MMNKIKQNQSLQKFQSLQISKKQQFKIKILTEATIQSGIQQFSMIASNNKQKRQSNESENKRKSQAANQFIKKRFKQDFINKQDNFLNQDKKQRASRFKKQVRFDQDKYKKMSITENSIVNPQIMQHLKNASSIVKQNQKLKQKYNVLKQSCEQKNNTYENQNKNFKQTILNYQQYIQKLFLTCQRLLISQDTKQKQLTQFYKKQLKEQNVRISKNRSPNAIKHPNYMEIGIKRLQKLLSIRYQEYMGNNSHDRNNNFPSENKNKNNTIIKSRTNNIQHQSTHAQSYFNNSQSLIDKSLQLYQKQSLENKIKSLLMTNGLNTQLLQRLQQDNSGLKLDYQKVYKQLFMLKKQKQQLTINFNEMNTNNIKLNQQLLIKIKQYQSELKQLKLQNRKLQLQNINIQNKHNAQQIQVIKQNSQKHQQTIQTSMIDNKQEKLNIQQANRLTKQQDKVLEQKSVEKLSKQLDKKLSQENHKLSQENNVLTQQKNRLSSLNHQIQLKNHQLQEQIQSFQSVKHSFESIRQDQQQQTKKYQQKINQLQLKSNFKQIQYNNSIKQLNSEIIQLKQKHQIYIQLIQKNKHQQQTRNLSFISRKQEQKLNKQQQQSDTYYKENQGLLINQKLNQNKIQQLEKQQKQNQYKYEKYQKLLLEYKSKILEIQQVQQKYSQLKVQYLQIQNKNNQLSLIIENNNQLNLLNQNISFQANNTTKQINQYTQENQQTNLLLKLQKQRLHRQHQHNNNNIQITNSQNITILESERKYKLTEQKYSNMIQQCHKLSQQNLIYDVRLKRLIKQIQIKDQAINGYLQKIFIQNKTITTFQQSNSILTSQISQFTNSKSILQQKLFQLQEDKQNLSIQLNIKQSELKAIMQSNPTSNQTSKGLLPVESVIVIQSKIDFLEEQLFKRIKNYHQIQKTNIQTLNINDIHYECKIKEIEMVKFIDQLQIYVQYLEKQKEKRFYQENDSGYQSQNQSGIPNQEPSIANNIQSYSNNSMIDSTDNPKKSPIIHLSELENSFFPPPIVSQNIYFQIIEDKIASSKNINSIKEPQENQNPKIDNKNNQENAYKPISPNSLNQLLENIGQRDHYSSSIQYDYSPSTTQKNLQKNKISKYLFESQDKGSKFSFNFISQKGQTQNESSSNNLTKRPNQLSGIQYYINRDSNFEFIEQKNRHYPQKSQLIQPHYDNNQLNNQFKSQAKHVSNSNSIFHSEIKHNQSEIITKSQSPIFQTQNKRSFLSGFKNKMAKPNIV